MRSDFHFRKTSKISVRRNLSEMTGHEKSASNWVICEFFSEVCRFFLSRLSAAGIETDGNRPDTGSAVLNCLSNETMDGFPANIFDKKTPQENIRRKIFSGFAHEHDTLPDVECDEESESGLCSDF